MILINKKITDKTKRTISKTSSSAPMQTENSAEI